MASLWRRRRGLVVAALGALALVAASQALPAGGGGAVVVPGSTGAELAPPGAREAAPAPVRSRALSPAITFDEHSVGTDITGQYAGAGVVFDDGAFIADDASSELSPVLSGTPTFQGDIVGRFVVPGTATPTTVPGFRMRVGYINNRDSVEISYYAADGSLQGAVRANELGFNDIVVERNGIASFRASVVLDEPAGFGIDDLAIGRAAPASTVTRMVSLGDSYSSGEGLLSGAGVDYFCGTNLHRGLYYKDTTVPYLALISGGDCDLRTGAKPKNSIYWSRGPTTYRNLCHRAPTAYPLLIGAALGVRPENAAFIACSGATMKNVGAPGVEYTAPSYDQSPFGVFGGELQYKNLGDVAGAKGAPDLITLGIGGNDIGFGSIVKACIYNNCVDDEQVTSVQSKLDGPVRKDLVATLSSLRSAYPQAKIAAFGYPSVIDPDVPACKGLDFSPTQQGIDDIERRHMADVLLPSLNRMIADAAADAGVTFIDITSATRGHEICTPDSWINGLEEGDDTIAGTGNESFHPNQKGHRAIADFFVRNYTDGAGRIIFENPAQRVLILPEGGGISFSFGTLEGGTTSACGAACIQPACTVDCVLNLQGQGYQPGMTLSVTLRSDPVTLGTVTTGADGSFAASLAVPASVPPGRHLAEVRGTAADGTTHYGATVVPVVRTAVRTRAPGLLSFRASKWRSGVLRVRFGCPRSSPRACRGTASLSPRAKGRALVSKKVLVRAGKRRVVALRPTRVAVRVLSRKRSYLRVSQKVLGTRRAVIARQRGRR